MWETIDLATAEKKFGIFSYENGAMPNCHPGTIWKTDQTTASQKPWPFRVMVHRGNMTLDDLLFDTNHFVAPEADMLVVDGNLTVEGDITIDQCDVGTPGYLIVKGDLHANNIFTTQLFEMLVWGDLTADSVIYGNGGSGGCINCCGRVSAPVTIMDEYLLRCKSLVGPVLVSYVPFWGDDVDNVKVMERGTENIITVAKDEDLWLLHLPEGVDPDEDFETVDDARPYAVLTEKLIAGFPDLSETAIRDILRQWGADAFRKNILESVSF